MKILASWVGAADLKAAQGKLEPEGARGPLGQALHQLDFDEAWLLTDYDGAKVSGYESWLKTQCATPFTLKRAKLSSPMDFGEIYKSVVTTLTDGLKKCHGDVDLTFHLSPGTSAMASVWILLGKTRFAATFIQSSPEAGVELASVPFSISAEFLPDLFEKSDRTISAVAAGEISGPAQFGDILYRSPQMARVVDLASRFAVRSVPILIQGESGVGKELFARAIHGASPRKDNLFVALNCGAIPTELIEAEFFGTGKYAFTGAGNKIRKGHFETADGGTIFLDEISEALPQVQVKLLRVLQEKEIVRVGETTPRKVDVRIITATNRDLVQEVREARFRDDLFFRLAVAVLNIPPLNAREGDIGYLAGHILAAINLSMTSDPGYQDKKLAPEARNILLEHPWPGNVRELQNTLQRAVLYSDGAYISAEVMKEAILSIVPTSVDKWDAVQDLTAELGVEFSLDQVLFELERKFIAEALKKAGGNKSAAARLLRISPQALHYKLKKHISHNSS